jgi:Uri superfamily endonuclease
MKGVYVLIVSINHNVRTVIGALGPVRFKKGIYAYVGSAQNNMEKRLARHLGTVKKKFWHIDYLLDSPGVSIRKVLTLEAGKVEECRLAALLYQKGSPVSGFGCSDCKCSSHLFKIGSYEFLRERLQESVVGSA